ncbi:MAG: GNAT family N-acetyltransferase [Clostridia bacterium]|nr:GNAT family N-acetyltransferase [Clostridia bacterium]
MVELYLPKTEDLWFREKLLGDLSTMSYNHAWGGTIPFPSEKWADWYDKWLLNHENKRFYRYIIKKETFLGEVAYRFDEERQCYIADVIVYAPYRGCGYGGQALALLCQAAKENGVRELYDDIAIDNPAVALFLRYGFSEIHRTSEYIWLKKRL